MKIAIFGEGTSTFVEDPEERNDMRIMEKPRVTITEEGRSGSIIYEDGDQRLTGWWEFAGGDAIAILNMGSTEQWRSGHAWALEQRSRILRTVADEVVRQKAPGCRADIDEADGWITIRR